MKRRGFFAALAAIAAAPIALAIAPKGKNFTGQVGVYHDLRIVGMKKPRFGDGDFGVIAIDSERGGEEWAAYQLRMTRGHEAFLSAQRVCQEPASATVKALS